MNVAPKAWSTADSGDANGRHSTGDGAGAEGRRLI